MVRLYLLGQKGYIAIRQLPDGFNSLVSEVIIGQDGNVEEDYFEQIKKEAERRSIQHYSRKAEPESVPTHKIAIGWRWLIADYSNLIVFHDSLLPRYRGFNPLVSALLNGDEQLGVTALKAAEHFDAGEIIDQWKISVYYPIKIQQAIELISEGYSSLLNSIMDLLMSGKRLKSKPQDETMVSYSVWRDEDDYFIDWSWSADRIKRFVDAVGFPYKGAKARLNDGTVVTVRDIEIWSTKMVENPGYGKVLLKEQGCPVVVVDKGLVRLTDMRDLENRTFQLQEKLRVKFV